MGAIRRSKAYAGTLLDEIAVCINCIKPECKHGHCELTDKRYTDNLAMKREKNRLAKESRKNKAKEYNNDNNA